MKEGEGVLLNQDCLTHKHNAKVCIHLCPLLLDLLPYLINILLFQVLLFSMQYEEEIYCELFLHLYQLSVILEVFLLILN